MTDELDDLISMPRRRACAMAHISRSRLAYWEMRGLLRPGIHHRVAGRSRAVELYTFNDLVSLLVVSELRQRGISLQHVRQIVVHLRDRGYPRPLAELQFATLGRDVYFCHPDGGWEGGRGPDQLVLREVLNLELLRRRVREATARPAGSYGRIERRRGSRGSRPVFAGTRLPVDTVADWLRDGHSIADVLDAYPDLAAEDVEAARAHAGI